MASLSEIRDTFQQRLLTCLYRGSEGSSLVLKGGAAMRVLTASARYTQDLDFDHDPRRSLASLQKTVRSAIARALQGHVVKIPVQVGDRTLPRVYVSVYDEQARAESRS
jgi:predicted nucleotidyltransferase component of viral defense system